MWLEVAYPDTIMYLKKDKTSLFTDVEVWASVYKKTTEGFPIIIKAFL